MFVILINKTNRACDVRTSRIALHARRRKQHMNRSCPSRNHVENVANCSSGGRGHDPNAARKNRQRAFQFFCKQSFSLQAIAKLFESDPQRAGTDGIECINDELILTARRVNRKLSARANLQTVSRSKTNANVCRAKALSSQLRVFVFEREVPVPG